MPPSEPGLPVLRSLSFGRLFGMRDDDVGAGMGEWGLVGIEIRRRFHKRKRNIDGDFKSMSTVGAIGRERGMT